MSAGPVSQHVGARLVQLREQLGSTQQEIADLLHVSQVSVSRMERGLRGFSVDDVYLLAEYFGRPVEQLLPAHLLPDAQSPPGERRNAALGL